MAAQKGAKRAPNDVGGSRRDLAAADANNKTSIQAGKSAMQGHRSGDAEAVEMLLAMQAPSETTQLQLLSLGGNTNGSTKVQKVLKAGGEVAGRGKGEPKATREAPGGALCSLLPPARSSKSNNFLPALYKMCNCNDHTKCITWTEDGCSFWVSNIEQVSALEYDTLALAMV
jgi:hypothetical protein